MYSKILFLSVVIASALLGFNQKVEAQKRKPLLVPSNLMISTNGGHCEYCCNCTPPTPYQHVTSGQQPLLCNTPTLADLPICDSLDASGNINVSYSLGMSEFTRYNKIFIVNKDI